MVYFCVYFVRQGVVNWGAFFLLDARGAASATDAAFRISGFEVGGLLANLSAAAGAPNAGLSIDPQTSR